VIKLTAYRLRNVTVCRFLFDVIRKERKMEIRNNNLIIRTGKEIDHMSAEKIRKEFEECYAQGRVRNVIFDLSDVEFMDSSGIGMIMGKYKKVRYFGGKVAVTGVPVRIDKILKMSGVYSFVSKYDNIFQALRACE